MSGNQSQELRRYGHLLAASPPQFHHPLEHTHTQVSDIKFFLMEGRIWRMAECCIGEGKQKVGGQGDI